MQLTRRALGKGALLLGSTTGAATRSTILASAAQPSTAGDRLANLAATIDVARGEPTQRLGGLFTWLDLETYFAQSGLSREVGEDPVAYQWMGFQYPAGAWLTSSNIRDLVGFAAEDVDQVLDLGFAVKLYRGRFDTDALAAHWESLGAAPLENAGGHVWDVTGVRHSAGYDLGPDADVGWFGMHWSHLQVVDAATVIAMGLGDTVQARTAARIGDHAATNALWLEALRHLPEGTVSATLVPEPRVTFVRDSLDEVDMIAESNLQFGPMPSYRSITFAWGDVAPVTDADLAAGASPFTDALITIFDAESADDAQRLAEIVSARCEELAWRHLEAGPGEALRVTDVTFPDDAPHVAVIRYETSRRRDVVRSIRHRQALPWARTSSLYRYGSLRTHAIWR